MDSDRDSYEFITRLCGYAIMDGSRKTGKKPFEVLCGVSLGLVAIEGGDYFKTEEIEAKAIELMSEWPWTEVYGHEDSGHHAFVLASKVIRLLVPEWLDRYSRKPDKVKKEGVKTIEKMLKQYRKDKDRFTLLGR
jgi:hypothetical protein